jgi:hypothetical protein
MMVMALGEHVEITKEGITRCITDDNCLCSSLGRLYTLLSVVKHYKLMKLEGIT